MKVDSIKDVAAPVPRQKADGKKEAGDFTNVLDALLSLLAPPVQQPAGGAPPTPATDSSDDPSADQLTIEQVMLSLLPVNANEDKDNAMQEDLPVVPSSLQLPTADLANQPFVVSQASSELSQLTQVSQATAVGAAEVLPQPPANDANEWLENSPSEGIRPFDLEVVNKVLGQEAPRISTEQGETKRTEDPRAVAPQVSTLPRPVELVERPIAPETLSALRAEIVSFSANPSRPAIILEVNPPEYGRVLVRAEQAVTGQVTVRLVVESLVAKEQVLLQLPKVQNTTEVIVFTAEEYREQQENLGQRQRERQQPQQQKGNRKGPRVEFII